MSIHIYSAKVVNGAVDVQAVTEVEEVKREGWPEKPKAIILITPEPPPPNPPPAKRFSLRDLLREEYDSLRR